MKCYVTLHEVSKVGKDTENYLTPDTLLSFPAVNHCSTQVKMHFFMVREEKKCILTTFSMSRVF